MSTLKENVHDLFDGWNTIPNWLSFIRIALIPVFAVLFVQGHQLVAVIVMICAALTDLSVWHCQDFVICLTARLPASLIK